MNKLLKIFIKYIVAPLIAIYIIGLASYIAFGHEFEYDEMFYHADGVTSIGVNYDYYFNYGITFHKLQGDKLWHAYFVHHDRMHVSKIGGKTVKETLKLLKARMEEIDEGQN